MPTYDYQCRTCGHRFDYFQSISSDPLTNCPVRECILEEEERKGTGEVYRRVSGGAGLVFKGEGFYLTDYARKGKGSGGEGGSGESSGGSSPATTSKGGSSSGGSSESKSPESKPSGTTSESKGSSSPGT